MKSITKKVVVCILLLVMMYPFFVDAKTSTKEWVEEDTDKTQPLISTSLKFGSTVSNKVVTKVVEGNLKENEEDEIYDYTTTTITEREISVTASNLTMQIFENSSDLTGVRPIKDANKKDLYLGNYDDPAQKKVSEDGPENFDYQFVGRGDYSSQYVSHVYVTYKKDANGRTLKDENGDYIIESLQHASGVIITTDGEPTTDLNAVYDQKTGTRALQYMLKDKEDNVVYAYCIDLETKAVDKYWYKIANLEDNNYYASEYAEKHVRAIVMNGYWGTASDANNDGKYDIGSLDLLKQKLKQALADNKIDKTVTVSYRENGVIVTEDITITNEVIDNLTEGEALDMTQAAIWSYANGAQAVQDGKDGFVVGGTMYGDMANGNRTGKNDPEGMARMTVLYDWLVNLDTKYESTVVINEKNYIKNLNLSIGNRVQDDIYEATVIVDLYYDATQKDNLAIHLTYEDANGEEKTIVKRLTGELKEGEEYAEFNENGLIIDELYLKNNSETKISLRLEGYQYLDLGAYIFTSSDGVDASQTFVSLAEGKHEIDINKEISIKFNVDDNNKYSQKRVWSLGDYEEMPPNTGIVLGNRYICNGVIFALEGLLIY